MWICFTTNPQQQVEVMEFVFKSLHIRRLKKKKKKKFYFA